MLFGPFVGYIRGELNKEERVEVARGSQSEGGGPGNGGAMGGGGGNKKSLEKGATVSLKILKG